MKIILKGCPRCGGDLVPDRWDLDGRDMCCVQCGFAAPPSLISGLRSRLNGTPSRAPASQRQLVKTRAA
jgi:hypothetical protein